MPRSETLSGEAPQFGDVLTLSEAAAYLRVKEETLRKMASQRSIPAQQIGGEWRFLKKALDNWMAYGNDYPRRPWMFPPELLMDSPFTDEIMHLIERRLLNKLKAETAPKPGSNEAVRQIIGILKDDDDLEARLVDARKRREAT